MASTELNAVIRYVRRMTNADGLCNLSDSQLLQLFVSSSNQHAFAHLLKRHGPMVYGTCHRILHNQQDVEDVFQAAFLALAQGSKKIGTD